MSELKVDEISPNSTTKVIVPRSRISFPQLVTTTLSNVAGSYTINVDDIVSKQTTSWSSVKGVYYVKTNVSDQAMLMKNCSLKHGYVQHI